MSYKTDVSTLISIDSARTDEILASIGDSIYQLAEDDVFASRGMESCILRAKIASVSSDLERRRSEDPCHYFIDRSDATDIRVYEVQLRVCALPSWENFTSTPDDTGCPMKWDAFIRVNLLMVDGSTLDSLDGEGITLLERLVRNQAGLHLPYTF